MYHLLLPSHKVSDSSCLALYLQDLDLIKKWDIAAITWLELSFSDSCYSIDNPIENIVRRYQKFRHLQLRPKMPKTQWWTILNPFLFHYEGRSTQTATSQAQLLCVTDSRGIILDYYKLNIYLLRSKLLYPTYYYIL